MVRFDLSPNNADRSEKYACGNKTSFRTKLRSFYLQSVAGRGSTSLQLVSASSLANILASCPHFQGTDVGERVTTGHPQPLTIFFTPVINAPVVCHQFFCSSYLSLSHRSAYTLSRSISQCSNIHFLHLHLLISRTTNTMKNAIAGSALLALAAASPQGPPGNFGPPGGGPPGGGPPGGIGPFASFPSCASSCWSNIASECNSVTDYSCLCGSSAVSSANSCIDSSDCSDSEKEEVYQAVDQLCANVGVTVTAKPEATWSATSGGSAWPAGWTTSAWPSGGPWGPGAGPPGWVPGNGWGPFGRGGPGNGWGPFGSGSWTNGPWTNWWGTGACPGSSWSGE